MGPVNKWWKKFFPPQPATPEDPNAPRWLRKVAMLTGVLAGFAGYLTVRSTALSNDAIYHSNQAVLKQAQASDTWAEYQADSVKSHVVQTSLEANPGLDDAHRKILEGEIEDFRKRQPALKGQAQAFEKDRDQENNGSYHRLLERDLLGYAGLATQLAIALASVAALTRWRGIFHVSIWIGVVGIAITGYAFMYHYFK